MKGALIRELHVTELRSAAERLLDSGGRMQMVYAWHPPGDTPELRYLADARRLRNVQVWRCKVTQDPPSLATIWPLLGWYEREIMDLYGIRFHDHPEPNRLVLPQHVPPPLAPPGRDTALAAIAARWHRHPHAAGGADRRRAGSAVRAGARRRAGIGRIHLPLYRRADPALSPASVLQASRDGSAVPGRRPGARHRSSPSACPLSAPSRTRWPIARRWRRPADCIVPPRACWLRVLLAELERVYNHLHYLGHLANTTTLKVGEAQGKLLEERAKQINARLTGSRFLRSLLIPGGLRRDLQPKPWLSEELEALRAETAKLRRSRWKNSESHLDRLITTGVLSTKVAFDQGATGPVQRASGTDRDLRRDHPYAAYAELPLTIPTRQEGDAYARSRVRIEEIDASIAMMQRVLLLLPDGRCPCALRAAAYGRGAGLDRIAARHACSTRCISAPTAAGAGQDQVAVVLQLARVSLHGARHEHDGLRDQRGQFRPHHLRLRAVGGNAMALWTLIGLAKGKATTPWPRAWRRDGQDGLFGMPRYNPDLCDAGCSACAEVCPTEAITARPDGAALEIDYGRCVVCQLCTEACPTGAMTTSSDWAFGVRHRDDLRWVEHSIAEARERDPPSATRSAAACTSATSMPAPATAASSNCRR